MGVHGLLSLAVASTDLARQVSDLGFLRDKRDAEKQRPHHAMDPYFYRSHLVHEQELEHLIFKSWIYALHASEIPSAGDYQLVEIGEDSIIVARTETGDIRAMHNICPEVRNCQTHELTHWKLDKQYGSDDGCWQTLRNHLQIC